MGNSTINNSSRGERDTPGLVNGAEMLSYNPSLEVKMKAAVREHIILPYDSPGELPNIVLLAGPCRTDTGALATALSQSESVETAHIQPIKTNRRSVFSLELTNEDITYARRDMVILPGSKTHIVKETVGIKSQAEIFDPLAALLDVGFPAEKLAVVATFKHPLTVFDSCAKVYGEGYASAENINVCYQQTLDMMTLAREFNIPAYAYVGELYLRDRDPHDSMRKLLEVLTLNYHNGVVDWDNGHGYNVDTTEYEIPPHRFISGSVPRSKGGRGGLVWNEHNMVLPGEQLEAAARELQPSCVIYEKAIQIANLIL